MKRLYILIAVLFAAYGVSEALTSASLTHTFSDGGTIQASEINQNDQDPMDWINNVLMQGGNYIRIPAGDSIKAARVNADTLGGATTTADGAWTFSGNITQTAGGQILAEYIEGDSLGAESADAITPLFIDNTATDGDPMLTWQLSGTSVFTMGVDDGDSDKFKIGTTAIGTGTWLTWDGTTFTIAGNVAATDLDGIVGSNTAAAGTFTTLVGTNIDGIVGANTAAAGSFTSLTSTSIDANGAADISDDLTLSAGADGALRFGVASSVKILDNAAASLVIEEADAAYLTFVTSEGGEKLTLGKKLEAGSVEIEGSGFDIDGGAIDGVTIGGSSAPTVTDLGSVATADINGGTIDGVTIGGASAAAGTFTTLSGNVADVTVPDVSAAPWGLSGHSLDVQAGTITDSGTSGSGTVASAVFTSFGTPTLAATNSSVTTTDAATVYISAAPANGTNNTITNAHALWVDAGNVKLDGTLKATGGGLLTGTWSDLGTVTTVDINGGSIDGATLGGAASVTVTSADINGGTLDGVVVGGASAAAGTFTAIVGTTITGSDVLSIDDDTESTSTTTGSIHTDGGLGVAKDAILGDTSTLFIGDDANANMTVGITIEGASGVNNEFITLKSGDVAQQNVGTGGSESDTYGYLKKSGNTTGGLNIKGFADTGGSGMQFNAFAPTPNATKATNARGVFEFYPTTNSGDNEADLGANANMLTIALGSAGTCRFIFDVEGSAHADVEWTTFSDSRLKSRIEAVPYGLSDVLAVDAKVFDKESGFINDDDELILEGNKRRMVGFIAQEVKAQMPLLVKDLPDDKSFYTLDYGRLTPVLWKAVQELSALNQGLAARVATLEAQVDSLISN